MKIFLLSNLLNKIIGSVIRGSVGRWVSGRWSVVGWLVVDGFNKTRVPRHARR